MRRLLAPLGAALVAASSLSAQTVPELTPGARLRITSPQSGTVPLLATLTAVRADTLVLSPAGFASPTVMLIPLGQVERLDVSLGRRRKPWQGLGIGLLAGATTGALLGYSGGDTDDFFYASAEDAALFFGALLGLTGGVIGLLAGTLWIEERWKALPVNGARLEVGAAPRGAGLAVRWSTRF